MSPDETSNGPESGDAPDPREDTSVLSKAAEEEATAAEKRTSRRDAIVAASTEAADSLPTEEPAVRRHPAADQDNDALPLADAGKFYIGMWGPKANYGCPYCPYTTLEGDGAVEFHVDGKLNSGDPRHVIAKSKEGAQA